MHRVFEVKTQFLCWILHCFLLLQIGRTLALDFFPLLKEKGHDPSAGFRGHKADIYEGGHRVPLIARWPAGIEAGQKTNALACLTDFYATMRDILGQAPAKEGNIGEDSFSLVPAFKGKQSTSRKTLISHSISGSFSFREGDWKLCLSSGSGGWSAPREAAAKKQKLPPLQLYNLNSDRAERNNLIVEHPDKVESLLKSLNEEVVRGRSTPGNSAKNDRQVSFLPSGVKMPK